MDEFLKEYIKRKCIWMEQFDVYVKCSQLKHMKNLKSKTAIDNYVLDLINPPVEREHRQFQVWCGNV